MLIVSSGAGLKSQHVSSIQWLAEATGAEVDGLSVGSHALEFRPTRKPAELVQRNIKIVAASAAASTVLIFQAVLPFLLFAGNDRGEPVELEISGGTNVSFSPSFEYVDQVLMPALEAWFGIRVDRQLKQRGWSTGSPTRGAISFKIHPLKPGETLKLRETAPKHLGSADFDIKTIDISIITPSDMHESLTRALARDLGVLFPDAEVKVLTLEESHHEARMYVLLVAHSATLRWG